MSTPRCECCGRYASVLAETGDGDDTGMVGPCCMTEADKAPLRL